jgi:hypothetical protein
VDVVIFWAFKYYGLLDCSLIGFYVYICVCPLVVGIDFYMRRDGG